MVSESQAKAHKKYKMTEKGMYAVQLSRENALYKLRNKRLFSKIVHQMIQMMNKQN